MPRRWAVTGQNAWLSSSEEERIHRPVTRFTTRPTLFKTHGRTKRFTFLCSKLSNLTMRNRVIPGDPRPKSIWCLVGEEVRCE
jgi:hypothetical protein